MVILHVNKSDKYRKYVVSTGHQGQEMSSFEFTNPATSSTTYWNLIDLNNLKYTPVDPIYFKDKKVTVIYRNVQSET